MADLGIVIFVSDVDRPWRMFLVQSTIDRKLFEEASRPGGTIRGDETGMAEKCERCGRTVRETLPLIMSHYDPALAREYVDKISWVCRDCLNNRADAS